ARHAALSRRGVVPPGDVAATAKGAHGMNVPYQSVTEIPANFGAGGMVDVRLLDDEVRNMRMYLDRLKRYLDSAFIRSDLVPWTPGTISNGAAATLTVTCRNASLRMTAKASFDVALPAGCFLAAQVTAADQVTVTLGNLSGTSQTLGAGNVRVDVEV